MTEMIQKVVEGIAVGAGVGAVLWLIRRAHDAELTRRDQSRIHSWLQKESSQPEAEKWRSTHAIASFTDLTENRVRFLCSTDKRIVRSSKQKEIWAIKDLARESNDS